MPRAALIWMKLTNPTRASAKDQRYASFSVAGEGGFRTSGTDRFLLPKNDALRL